MFENLGNIGNMMKQAMQMKDRMAEVQAELESQNHQGSSGGGMVVVTVNGKGDIQNIKINPEVVKPEDVEMLEELVMAASSSAIRQAQDATKEAISAVTGGLNIPGLDKLMGGGKG